MYIHFTERQSGKAYLFADCSVVRVRGVFDVAALKADFQRNKNERKQDGRNSVNNIIKHFSISKRDLDTSESMA